MSRQAPNENNEDIIQNNGISVATRLQSPPCNHIDAHSNRFRLLDSLQNERTSYNNADSSDESCKCNNILLNFFLSFPE